MHRALLALTSPFSVECDACILKEAIHSLVKPRDQIRLLLSHPSMSMILRWLSEEVSLRGKVATVSSHAPGED